jgi:hypothetical protein
VPVLPALAQELRTHLQGRRQGYLFESNRHTLYSARTLQAMVKRFARQAGIAKRVYPHLLRHSIATILLDSGLVPVRPKRPDAIHYGIQAGKNFLHVVVFDRGGIKPQVLAGRLPQRFQALVRRHFDAVVFDIDLEQRFEDRARGGNRHRLSSRLRQADISPSSPSL